MTMLMPIARRISEARLDALQSGHQPVKCRISPKDMRELDMWVRQQNRPLSSGLPPQQLDKNNLFGMSIVEDEKVKEVLVLEMKPKEQVAR